MSEPTTKVSRVATLLHHKAPLLDKNPCLENFPLISLCFAMIKFRFDGINLPHFELDW
jgi:hypothetical protein